ncbi:YkvA family protein [Virgibacillus sp. DJP39]|uniref:YkvA family protein n=1 Tax=Virgibacillus sp. DJP39 TaxID=3409790 RepID=UPI003BB6DC38
MSNEKNYKDKLKKFKPAQAIEGSQKHFSENKFSTKMLKYAKVLGTKLAYYSFLLFYAFKSPNTPKSAKLTIAGALGYLILPIDFIPDFIPLVGLTDDSAVIVYALYRIISHIDEPIKQKADEKMKKFFGKNYDRNDIDEKLVVDQKEDE